MEHAHQTTEVRDCVAMTDHVASQFTESHKITAGQPYIPMWCHIYMPSLGKPYVPMWCHIYRPGYNYLGLKLYTLWARIKAKPSFNITLTFAFRWRACSHSKQPSPHALERINRFSQFRLNRFQRFGALASKSTTFQLLSKNEKLILLFWLQ